MRSVLVSLIFFYSYLSANAEKLDSLNVLNVKEEGFVKVLDHILNQEKACAYYSPNLIYMVNLQSFNDSCTVQIGSVGIRTIKIGNEIGCFIFDGHLFIVSGGKFDELLFDQVNERKYVNFLDPKKKRKSTSGRVIITSREDDSFSFWTYQYKKGDFYVVETHKMCMDK
jgi:hypothetical protein